METTCASKGPSRRACTCCQTSREIHAGSAVSLRAKTMGEGCMLLRSSSNSEPPLAVLLLIVVFGTVVAQWWAGQAACSVKAHFIYRPPLVTLKRDRGAKSSTVRHVRYRDYARRYCARLVCLAGARQLSAPHINRVLVLSTEAGVSDSTSSCPTFSPSNGSGSSHT
ncbi:hypothetical protein HPB51_018255 [Rhipicephalus microplus]|uniref:Uncharacterized protein n=1 Tax=Rhipicephalus microplus TaxID=6941 RepID=A0A9J6D696_RHIMP|nr:hypothetical protein HPB51_018255 [Rhipicephalus microplus]